MSEWRQLLVGAIVPDIGERYEFKDYVGNTIVGTVKSIGWGESRVGAFVVEFTDREPLETMVAWFRPAAADG